MLIKTSVPHIHHSIFFVFGSEAIKKIGAVRVHTTIHHAVPFHDQPLHVVVGAAVVAVVVVAAAGDGHAAVVRGSKKKPKSPLTHVLVLVEKLSALFVERDDREALPTGLRVHRVTVRPRRCTVGTGGGGQAGGGAYAPR